MNVTSWILVFGFGALGLVAWVVRRRKPKSVVPWIPDERPDEVRLESYRDEVLRELGLPYGIDVDRRPPR